MQSSYDKEAHAKEIKVLVSEFQTHADLGLSGTEAAERLGRIGPNELSERPRPGFLALLWDQFNNYLVIILIIAALISLALGEYVDSMAIMIIVVLNSVVGVIQESKAEQALAALKKMSAPNASRNGPLARPPRNSASSRRTPHSRSVRITRSCAGAERAVTSAVRIGAASPAG